MRKTAVDRNDQVLVALLVIVLCAIALWAVGCGGGGGAARAGPTTVPNTSTSSGTSGGTITATVTLTATGISDSTPRISSGDRIRFTNSDSSPHQILTTPHLIHTDCPGLNSVGLLAPGQSGVSDPLTGSRGCGFHDHLNADENKFRGQVLVGLSAGEPPPPDPYYLRH